MPAATARPGPRGRNRGCPGTTPERLTRGAAAGLITADERDTLLGGFDRVYSVLSDIEARAHGTDSVPTTYLRPRDLDTLTRRLLRETLRAVRSVQNRVDDSWMRRIGPQSTPRPRRRDSPPAVAPGR